MKFEEGEPNRCPGRCNPRNYKNSKRTQAGRYDDALRPLSGGLTEEDRAFLRLLSERMENRKRARGCTGGRTSRKIVAFLVFLFLHGCIATLAKNYQHYQTFLATQFCGFITIMFWNDET